MKPDFFISRVKTIENKDETFSHSGTKDFQEPDTAEVKTLAVRGSRSQPRTRASQNNSYT